MEMPWDRVHWPAISTCVVVGQIFLTVWFVALFGQPWARAYGVEDKKQHMAEVPGYTYGVGLLCMVLLTTGLAFLQARLEVSGVAGGLTFGFFVAVHFCIATALPGYAFLKRWSAGALAIGSQSALILLLSTILAVWQKAA